MAVIYQYWCGCFQLAKILICIDYHGISMLLSSKDSVYLKSILSQININDKQTQALIKGFLEFASSKGKPVTYPLLKIWLKEKYPNLSDKGAEIDLWNIFKLVSLFKQYDVNIAASSFSDGFRKSLYQQTGYDPSAIQDFIENHQKDAKVLATIANFMNRSVRVLGSLYKRYPLETTKLNCAINSLIKVSEEQNSMKRDVVSNILYKHLFPQTGKAKIKHASNKDIFSNFTDQKLDYKSKQDFWSVENGYIVRTFKTGEVIDESGN